MNNFILFFKNSLGQKMILGATGLGLSVFVLVHMLGNLFILSGSKAYNLYAYQLHEIKIIEFLEIGLFGSFIAHIVMAAFISVKNRISKGPSYKKTASNEKKTSLSNRLLVFQGVALFFFLISHLLLFKFGEHYEITIDGKNMRDIYLLVTEVFKNPFYVGGYTAAILVLAFHLVHGLAASVRTLGFYHPNYTPLIEKFSLLFGLIIMVGFLYPIFFIFFFL